MPNQQVWLNKLYFQISNSKEKKCLTIDTRDVNELDPGKLRTSTDDGEERTCYFNRNKSDTHFTSFIAKRILNRQQTLTFSIVKVSSDFNLVNKSLDIQLKTSLADGNAKRQYQQVNREDLNNGRSETEQITRKSIIQRQRGGQYDGRRVRKKPRFLSADGKQNCE